MLIRKEGARAKNKVFQGTALDSCLQAGPTSSRISIVSPRSNHLPYSHADTASRRKTGTQRKREADRTETVRKRDRQADTLTHTTQRGMETETDRQRWDREMEAYILKFEFIC